ncbi:MAG TPA: 4-hydroxy-tetrahydrodipicolinate synthase [Deltaproteobacteria bacterium]|nr:4-hydroxy-tetrahydrodipicolinate synthase [Deltaproteobacteria bacterium]
MFEGSGVALVTPFKNGKIDEAALLRLIEEQIAGGTRLLVPCGTTGESATLSHEEHDRIIEITVAAAKKRVKVLAGAGSNSTEEAIRLTRHAQRAGADGTLHICPYYNRPTQEGLYRHFEAIAKACEFPLVLYNIPGRTGVNLLPKTIARLAKLDGILGIKEASASLVQVSEILESCPPDFTVLSGEDALTFPMLALGAKGAISVTANLLPKLCAEMFHAAEQENWKRARQIHFELAPMNRVLFIETNPAPVKTALALMKKISPELRLPLAPLAPESSAELERVLKSYSLL